MSVITTICAALKIGVTMNKLDTFNKDKIKCLKCKEYYDKNEHNNLCLDCSKEWTTLYCDWSVITPAESFEEVDKLWEAFLNE